MSRSETRKACSGRRARIAMECLESRNLQSAVSGGSLAATFLQPRSAPAEFGTLHSTGSSESVSFNFGAAWGGGKAPSEFPKFIEVHS